MGELDAAVVVDLPLRGEWTVERTPAHRIPSHGTDLFGQRYAFDFVRTDHRHGFHLHPAGAARLLILGGTELLARAFRLRSQLPSSGRCARQDEERRRTVVILACCVRKGFEAGRGFGHSGNRSAMGA